MLDAKKYDDEASQEDICQSAKKDSFSSIRQGDHSLSEPYILREPY